MRNRDEERLRQKLRIPEDYELCTLTVDFIRHKGCKSNASEDLLIIARVAQETGRHHHLTLCHGKIDYPAETKLAGSRWSYGYDISDAMNEIEPGTFPIHEEVS